MSLREIILAVTGVGVMFAILITAPDKAYWDQVAADQLAFEKKCKELNGTPNSFKNHPRVCVLFEGD